jgi:molybdopterin molybdotransferase
VLRARWHSTMDVPPMDNSAMDGYAVRTSEVTAPETRLRIAQRIAAGEWASRSRPARRRASSPARRSLRAPTPS